MTPMPPKQVDPIALGGEHDVEARRLLAAPVEIEVGVDGPEGAGSQLGRQVIPQAVVDVQVEVEALSGHTVQVAGWKCSTSTNRSRARWQ